MVKYINVNKEKLPVCVSYYALAKLKEETGKGLGEWKDGDIGYLEPLLFYALESGYRAEKKELRNKKRRSCFYA